MALGLRPELEHFEKYSESVPHSVSSAEQEGDNLTVFVDGVSNLDDFFYVGVLPHPEMLEVQNISFLEPLVVL